MENLELENQIEDTSKKNIDFNRLDKHKLVELIHEMRSEIIRLKTEGKKTEDQNADLNKSIKSYQKKIGNSSEYIKYLARKISPSFREMTISSNEEIQKLSDDQIGTMILKDYLKEKKFYQEKIIEFEQKQIQNNRLIAELTNQQMKMVSYKNQEEIASADAFVDKDDEVEIIRKAIEEKDVVEDSDFRKISDAITTDEGNHIGITTVSFEDVKSKLREEELEFLKILGTKGYSLYPEIEEILKENLGFTSSKVLSVYNNLRSLRVIDVLDGDNIVKTFLRTNGVRVLWLNKEIGVPIYIELFKEKPVKPEKDKMIEENDNLAHGYSIKETCDVLKELGYLNISMDRKENTIKLDSNKLWIPDIIADDPVSKKKIYFEVEYANHTKDEFETKLTKANLRASTLRIITNSVINKSRLIRKVETWISKRESKSTSMLISVGSFKELREKKSWGSEFK